MAKSSFTATVVVFALLIFLASLEMMPMAEAKVCERRSKTWTGPCLNSRKCSDQCKSREDARSGSCHWDPPGFACFCYFNCQKSMDWAS